MDIVRKIIRAYLYNPMPEKVQRQFRSWCLREEGSHEKTEALREEWERLYPLPCFRRMKRRIAASSPVCTGRCVRR